MIGRTNIQDTTNAGYGFQNLIVGAENTSFGGNTSFLQYQGVGNVLFPGGLPVERIMGANFATNLGGNGSINASYLLLDSNQFNGFAAATTQRFVNRAEIFGGNIDYTFSKINAGASFGQINYDEDDSRALDDENNKYYEAHASYAGDNFGVSGGYRHIEAQYQAPGDWGRYGLIRNPTNVKGYNINGTVSLTGALKLTGGYENLEQIIAGDGTIEKYTVNLGYDLPSGVKLFGGYENTTFEDFGTNPDAEYSFVTAGVGYNFSSNSTFTLQYQYADVDNDFVIGNNRGTGGTFKGSFFSSQLSVKF
ncbi:porin [bacterium]|nr:MAG: porin [bacterium]